MNAIMNACDEYQRFTEATAVYPLLISGTGRSVYLPLGLTDEAGELAEKISAFTSKLAGNYKFGGRTTAILGEVGDVLWYCARLLASDGLPLSAYMGKAYEGPAMLDHIALFICAKAGIVAGRAKKLLRDGAGWTADDVAEKVYKPQHEAIRDILAALGTLCRFFGTTLEQVAYENKVKLEDRQARNKLNGDGDNR